MKVYISGPITGYPGLNREAFEQAASVLDALGHDPLNPFNCGVPDGAAWSEYLRADLRMVTKADALAVLPDWQASRGACLEVHVAHALGMAVLPIEWWRAA